VREEKFLKEEPDRLESALRRCKKLTGTLVTLKRFVASYSVAIHQSPAPRFRNSEIIYFFVCLRSLASVQEQRLPPNEPTISEEPPRSADISAPDKVSAMHLGSRERLRPCCCDSSQYTELVQIQIQIKIEESVMRRPGHSSSISIYILIYILYRSITCHDYIYICIKVLFPLFLSQRLVAFVLTYIEFAMLLFRIHLTR